MRLQFLVLPFLLAFLQPAMAEGQVINVGGAKDQQLLELLKPHAPTELRPLTVPRWEPVNDFSSQRVYKETAGVMFALEADAAEQLHKRLHEQIRALGYFAFLTQGHFPGDSTDAGFHYYFAVVAQTDQYDVVRLIGTEAVNYDLSTEDIISRLQKWEQSHAPLLLQTIDEDAIHAILLRAPDRPDQLVEEIYDFCPDAVDQGVGTMEAMREQVVTHRLIPLWWD